MLTFVLLFFRYFVYRFVLNFDSILGLMWAQIWTYFPKKCRPFPLWDSERVPWNTFLDFDWFRKDFWWIFNDYWMILGWFLSGNLSPSSSSRTSASQPQTLMGLSLPALSFFFVLNQPPCLKLSWASAGCAKRKQFLFGRLTFLDVQSVLDVQQLIAWNAYWSPELEIQTME